MKALLLERLDGPDGLRIAQAPSPEAGSGGVLIQVAAAGVCFPDLLMSHGDYQVQPELPAVLGIEVAGTVLDAPPDARWKVGDRVCASLDGGGFAEVAVASPERVFALPDGLDFVQGAALPVNFLTAVFALGRRGGLEAGEKLAVLGAGGGLGTALVAVGAARGARILAVVSSEEKGEIARRAGAEKVAVGPDWRAAALAWTDGEGVDVVADVVGGDATLEAVRATRPEGRVLILGFASGTVPAIAANRLLLRNVGLLGVGLGALASRDPNLFRECSTELKQVLHTGLEPVVGEVFPLESGSDALRMIQDRSAGGKLVLSVS